MYCAIVVGGGLAGLINAILLNRAGHQVHLIEKKSYPFHRVCGEYISNEVLPFLKEHKLFPEEYAPAEIDQFLLSSTQGKFIEMPLDLGGFGISRYSYDHWLCRLALQEGVTVRENTSVENISFSNDSFSVSTREHGAFNARVVIGAFGKRSILDKALSRSFIEEKSPYIGVKYHIHTDRVAPDLVALHNFEGGYCGVSRVENNVFNLCYLSHRSNLKKHKTIEQMEKNVLYQNPLLKDIYDHADFLFEKPEVINEISFAPKEPVYDHILMAGDSAGMITPLCGNGMAMAIHAAKICSDAVIGFLSGKTGREAMELTYRQHWNQHFKTRHWAGRNIQRLFGGGRVSNLAVALGKFSKPTANYLMKQTHGVPF